MSNSNKGTWNWQDFEVEWNIEKSNTNEKTSILLIHGFGACKEHWRYNQKAIGEERNCFAIDLIGFGGSSQPVSRLKGEENKSGYFNYCFEGWSEQVASFCKEIIKGQVILVGNSIGGVISLRAGEMLKERCKGIILIDCAQRTMDDKRLNEQPIFMQINRPLLKQLVRQRWLSKALFANAIRPNLIRQVLKKAYPSEENLNDSLIEMLIKPAQRVGASEAFRGFINIFDDYLAPDLLSKSKIPIHMIWGECDPWEPIKEAKRWERTFNCIRSLEIIQNAGHCPHDERPKEVNYLIKKFANQIESEY